MAKPRLGVVALLGVLSIGGCGAGSKGGARASHVRPDDLWRLAPAGTFAGLVVTDVTRAADAYGQLQGSLAAHPQGGALVATLGLDARAFGFDVTSPAAWQAAGIDPSAGLGVYVLPHGQPVLALAFTDKASGPATMAMVLPRLAALLHGAGGTAICVAVGPRSLCGFDAGVLQAAAASGARGGAGDGVAARLTRDVPAAQRGGLVEWFQALPEGGAREAMLGPAGQLLEGATLMFVAGELSDHGVVVRSWLAGAGKSEDLSLLGRRTGGGPGGPGSARTLALATLGDDGAGLIAGTIDLKAVWDRESARNPKLDNGKALLRQFFGLDLDRDILGTLDGEFAVVSRPAKHGLALILAAHDAAGAKHLADKIDGALKQVLMLVGIMGGMPAGMELTRQDAKDVAPGAHRVVIKAPPELGLEGLRDDLGRVTVTYLAVGDTLVVALDPELARWAASRGAADARHFRARMRAGATLVDQSPLVMWSELLDPLEIVAPNVLAQCVSFATVATNDCQAPVENSLRMAALARFSPATLRAGVEAVRWTFDHGDEGAASLDLQPGGVAGRLELTWGSRRGDGGARYQAALVHKYAGDYDGYKTELWALARAGKDATARRARLTVEGLGASWSPVSILVGTPMLMLLM